MQLSSLKAQHIVLTVVILLSVPFVAMQFTEQVLWSPADFVVMGGLLMVLGFAMQFVFKKFSRTSQKLLAGAAVFLVFLIIYIELAVGLIGTPFAGS